MTPAGAGSCVRSSSSQGRRAMEGGAACNGDVAFLDLSSTSLASRSPSSIRSGVTRLRQHVTENLVVDFAVKDVSSMTTADRLEF
ncbi:hypothetical protein E4U09_006959 [Claviceps aff. purpurea]|uniref:Uncharacterized protein n=1 Tax=Claviceps aff. purpurea TaxID=1967640 RepID=A0A9P7QQG4_9HYPO|nr:hypothetical protein E4U09_006959 [Claviceps aff. purpurea]